MSAQLQPIDFARQETMGRIVESLYEVGYDVIGDQNELRVSLKECDELTPPAPHLEDVVYGRDDNGDASIAEPEPHWSMPTDADELAEVFLAEIRDVLERAQLGPLVEMHYERDPYVAVITILGGAS